MLSMSRLIKVLVPFSVICMIFAAYNGNEQKVRDIVVEEDAEADERFIKGNISNDNEYEYLLVGDEKKEIYKEIYSNVQTLFNDLKMPYKTMDNIEKSDLSENKVIIFCDEVLGDYIELQLLGDFVSRGGHVILAAGLSEGNRDAYMQPYCGIAEKNSRFSTQKLHFTDSLFPVQFDEMTYSTYNMSTRISVRDTADIFIEDDSGVPVVYTNEFDDGVVGIINGTFLRDIKCSGMLTGIIGNVLEDFVYPVLGVKMVYLDNFPVFSVLNDVTSIDLYGRNSESFIREVIWPAFSGFSLRTETPLTISVITQASEEDTFSEINTSFMAVLGKETIQYGGELAYASYCPGEGDAVNNEELISDYKEIFPEYDIGSVVIMGDSYSEDNKAIGNSDIAAYRGLLDSKDEKLRFYASDEHWCIAGATFGNHIVEEELFEITSVLAAYGYIAHTFDMSTLMSEDTKTATWDERKKDIGAFSDNILNKTTYLKGSTLMNTKNEVKSFTGLEYSWTVDDNTLHISADSFAPNQPFYYRTNKKILSARGATYENIGNGYYMIRLTESKAEVYLEDM